MSSVLSTFFLHSAMFAVFGKRLYQPFGGICIGHSIIMLEALYRFCLAHSIASFVLSMLFTIHALGGARSLSVSHVSLCRSLPVLFRSPPSVARSQYHQSSLGSLAWGRRASWRRGWRTGAGSRE